MKKKSANRVLLETEDEEQRYGRNKDTIINRTYIIESFAVPAI